MKKFHLDKRNGKFMGVCAGIANYAGIDPVIVRICMVVATLLGGAPWTLIAYGVAAWAAKPEGLGYDREEAPRLRTSTHDVRQTMRDIDRRMAEVETVITSSNSRLAREIEELR
jgi:phage shock protein C